MGTSNERGHFGKYKGMVEKEQDTLIVEMVTMGLSVLAMNGVLLSEREEKAFHRAVYTFVSQSVEIEAKLVMKIERAPGGPKEAA